MSKNNLKWDANLYQKSSLYQYNLGMMTLEQLKPKDFEKILEIGYGNGMITIELAKMIPNGLITAIEISKEMIEQVKINLIKQSIKNVNLVNKNALEIDYINEFDAIFSNSAIHWIRNLELMYKLIYNALKPKGRIMIQTGLRERNILSKTVFKMFQIKEFREFFRNFQNPWRFLTATETKKILIENNFRDIKILTYHYQMNFKNRQELINYFKASTFVPFFEIIPENARIDFTEKFIETFLSLNKPKELSLTTPRFFISANK